MKPCARCPAAATLESLLPGPEGTGLVTEWLCLGCAHEKVGKPRDWQPKAKPRKGKPRAAAPTPATPAAPPTSLFE